MSAESMLLSEWYMRIVKLSELDLILQKIFSFVNCFLFCDMKQDAWWWVWVRFGQKTTR